MTGGDRVRWLNGMVTNNVRDLAPDMAFTAFLLNAQGHIQADLYAYNRGDSLMVDTGAAQRKRFCSCSITTSSPTTLRSRTSATK